MKMWCNWSFWKLRERERERERDFKSLGILISFVNDFFLHIAVKSMYFSLPADCWMAWIWWRNCCLSQVSTGISTKRFARATCPLPFIKLWMVIVSCSHSPPHSPPTPNTHKRRNVVIVYCSLMHFLPKRQFSLKEHFVKWYKYIS